ncbi:Ig-like domain-containing protein [Mycobacterium sp. EPa45]|uniref:beta strand repeat-containing protein n=1 Tax=Mycobacterium sp. EPa45 TaxID=1545728 RepID=UPI00130D8FA2|nr:Ig-like domain-containing protein [Mycobacterium sp. EPa45]
MPSADSTTAAPVQEPTVKTTVTARKSTTARAAYSMNGDLSAVQDGAGPITTPAQYDIQTTLDAWAAQLDALMTAPLTPANGWLKFPLTFMNAFFKPSIVVDRLSYGLNGLATLMDEFVPPFKMVDGAPSTITPASVTAAVLAGAIVLLNTSQTVDIKHWIDEAVSIGQAMYEIAQNPVINGLTANDLDGVIGAARSAFLSPKTVLDMTVDLGPAPNPVSLAMYVVVVAIFRRFADVATDHQPVVTDMQQTSQHLPNGSGTTVSGYVQFYDADGDPITSFGFTEPNDSRFTVTVVDGTNGRMNWTVWDWNPLSSDKSPKTLTFTMTVLAQGDGQISVSKPYMPNGNETQKTVTVTVYYNQAIGSLTNTVGSTSPMGVVRGTVSAPANPDNPMTYSLSGASGGSAYTANGGIVKLNPTTGAYTYVPNRASSATTDSFQLTSTDSFGHTYTTTVSVPVSSSSPVTTTNTTPGTVTGSLNNAGDAGLLTYSIGAQPNPLRGTVTLNPDGTFTYTRSAAAHTQPTTDSFTILGTDSSGKTVTIAVVNVNPTVSNSAPVGNGVLTDSPVGAPTYNALGGPRDEQHTTGQLRATDADGDAVTFAAGTYTTAQGGSITVDANGRFTYDKNVFAPFGIHNSYWHDHAVDGDPGDLFTINVSDGFGGTTAVTYSVPIAKLNAAPTVNSGTVNNRTTSAMGVVRGSIAGSDGDGDSLTYSMVGATGGSVYGSGGGILKIASDGTFTYIPKVGVTSDSFQVQVNDGHGGITTATVTLSGLTTPSPQTNTNTTAGVTTGSLNVPAGDSGLGLTYSLGSGPSKGTVTVNPNGTYTYTRTAGLGHTTTPTDSFTITATDATGKTVTIATITVSPTVANTAPAGNGVTVGSSSLTRVVGPNDQQDTTGTLKATDAEGDALTWAAGTYSTAQGGSVTVNANGTFSYTIQKYAWFGVSDSYWHDHAVPGDPGDTFTINVSDAFGGTTAVTYGIPIEKQNAAPTLSGSVSSSSTSGLGVVRGSIAGGSDGDGDTLSYTLVGTTGGSVYGSNGGIITMSGTSFTYIPKVGVTSDSFQVQVNDGHGGSTTATVNLSGLTTPSPQTNTNGVAGVTTGSLNVPAGDTGLGLTYSLGGAPSKGSVTVNANGTYTYTRTAGLGHTVTPNDFFTIKATDATGKSVIIATINVAPSVSNNAPTATVNGSSGTVTLSGPGSKTNPNAAGVQTVTGMTFVASDADSDALLINNKFDGTGTTFALASGGTIATANGGTVTVNSNGTMSYSISQSAAYFHAAAKMGASTAQKTDWFNFTVTDGYGGTSTVTVVIPIYAENRDPVTSAVKVGNSWTSIKATDPDGETISTTKLSSPPSDANPGSGYIVSTGDSLAGSLNLGTASLTKLSSFTITVYDGYWRTSNGVVTSTPGQKQV